MRDEARADALLASLEQEHKGKLKVFLGAAPGVGKTYAMLQAVREQAREGENMMLHIFVSILAIINGSAIVICKGGAGATVYCGRKCDRDFAVKSLASSLKALI